MEVTRGNLARVFTGLKAAFLRAAANVPTPAAGRLVKQEQGISRSDEYPMSGLLGDLQPLVDELYMTNIWAMVQKAKPIEFAAGLGIRRLDILNDQIGLYKGPIEELALRANTHAMRNVAATLEAGFVTPWVPDGQTVYGHNHTWPGGQAWDNLETFQLNANNFDIACQHLEQRNGPDGQPLGLSPKLLVVGPLNRSIAETILNMQFIGGGNSNRQYKRCDLLILPRITGLNWFVIDDDPYNVANLPGREGEQQSEPAGPKPLLLDMREEPWTDEQTSGDSDEVFERSRYRFKAAVTYVFLIICPWLIQASETEQGGLTTEALPTTTTTTEGA